MKGCRPFTEAEVVKVHEAIEGRHAGRDRALFVLGIHTGFRIAELLSLQVGDVWDGSAIADRVHVNRRHMKKQTEGRTVPLHSRAKEALMTWLVAYKSAVQALRADAPLFPGHWGAASSLTRVGAWRALKRAFEKAGLAGPGLATHSMRKSFAARVYERVDHDLVKTQKAMGHRNINSTVSYIAFLDADIDRAILGV